MPNKRKFYIRTFGCQMNEHDSLKMGALLEAEGYLKVDVPENADIILFNTCTVREKPHHKAVSEVGRALKLKKKKPHLVVGMTGCVAQEEKGNLFDLLPGLDIVLGPDQISRLPEILKACHSCPPLSRRVNSGRNPNALDPRFRGDDKDGGILNSKIVATELVNDPDEYNWQLLRTTNDEQRTTSFVTIMKGCNNFCSFCIVPYVRGREVSKPPEDIVAEIDALCKGGVREVTLLGQNVNSYSGSMLRSFDGAMVPLCDSSIVKDGHRTIEPSNYRTSFTELVRKISNETDILRIRYTSPHPKDLSDDLIEEHRGNKKLCEHIHLPLQVGSTNVLKRMNRMYTRDDYIKRTRALKKYIPNIAITTDIIVGFPNESDDDFKETLEVMEEVGFDGMFAFKYSTRPGTKAHEKYSDDVPDDVKASRLAQVLELNEKIVLQKHQKYVETVQEVLVEGLSKKSDDRLTGRTRTNKVVNFNGKKKLVGKLVDVGITWAGVNSLKGEIIN